MSTELTNPKRRNWQLHRVEQKSTYALALINLNHAEQHLGLGVVNASRSKINEFSFKVNPRTMDLEEPAAVVIKPTQGGGQYIEHQGQIYKNINITGTTGLRPNASTSSLKGVTIDPETGLPDGERTGFDDLIDLRNLFREYYMAKTNAELANSVVMVWKNGKEGEYYIVEPITFKTSRDSSSPLTAKYTISLRTIKRFEQEAIDRIEDSHMSRKAPEKKRARMNRFIQGLADDLETLNKNFDSSLSSVAKFITDIMRPTNELLQAISSVANTSQRVFEIPRSALNTLSSNLADAINDVSALAFNASQNYIVTYGTLATAFRSIRRVVLSILAEDSLFSTNVQDTLNVKKMQFVDSVFGDRDSGGDPLALINESMGAGVAQAVVGAGDNIRKLSKRLLGKAARWKALVIANGLKAPYVSPDGDGIDVLRPGDKILFPTAAASRTAVAAESSGKHRTLSPVEERLGRDIKITSPTSAGGITTFDFQVSGGGDVALAEGRDNMVQGVRIKFETEQGELPLHPFFGIKFPLGVKSSAANGFIEFDVNARSTLLSDPRIDEVASLDVGFVGNTLEVRGDVTIKGFDSDLSFDFSTRR